MKSPIRFRSLPFFLVLFLSAAQAAPAPVISERRGRHEHWQDASRRALRGVRTGSSDEKTALDSAVAYSELDPASIIPFMGTSSEFERHFVSVRDARFLEDPEVRGWSRRLSWMYPDDGCFTRAEWMARMLERVTGTPVHANKVFAFGNLVVKTPNHPTGEVSWWYHVVVGFRLEGEPYVYDPAINPGRPLLLKEWVSLIDPNPAEVKIAVCAAGAYHPRSPCGLAKSGMSDEEAADATRDYLRAERKRISELGRSPDRELGEFPPWKRDGR